MGLSIHKGQTMSESIAAYRKIKQYAQHPETAPQARVVSSGTDQNQTDFANFRTPEGDSVSVRYQGSSTSAYMEAKEGSRLITMTPLNPLETEVSDCFFSNSPSSAVQAGDCNTFKGVIGSDYGSW